jgi:hypothetical protein
MIFILPTKKPSFFIYLVTNLIHIQFTQLFYKIFHLYIYYSTQRIRCMNGASFLMICKFTWWWPNIRAETCRGYRGYIIKYFVNYCDSKIFIKYKKYIWFLWIGYVESIKVQCLWSGLCQNTSECLVHAEYCLLWLTRYRVRDYATNLCLWKLEAPPTNPSMRFLSSHVG